MKADYAYPFRTRELVERETLRRFATREPGVGLVLPMALLLVAICLRDQVPEQGLMLWIGATLLCMVVELALCTQVLRQLDAQGSRTWLKRWLLLVLFLQGLCWGLSPLLLWRQLGQGNAVLATMFLSALCCYALYTLALIRPMLWAFLLPLLLPLAISQSFLPDAELRNLGITAFLLLVLGLYLGERSYKRLHDAVEATVRNRLLSDQIKASVADLRTATRAVRRLSSRDSLTQCYNRRALTEQLLRAMHRQDRDHSGLGMMLIDVDDFNQINRVHGHLVGDQALKALCDRVSALLRGSDFLARFAGEEFIAVVHANNADELLRAAQRIADKVAQSPLLAASSTRVSVSIGVVLRQVGETEERLIARAMEAMSLAKEGGYGQVAFVPAPGAAEDEAAAETAPDAPADTVTGDA